MHSCGLPLLILFLLPFFLPSSSSRLVPSLPTDPHPFSHHPTQPKLHLAISPASLSLVAFFNCTAVNYSHFSRSCCSFLGASMWTISLVMRMKLEHSPRFMVGRPIMLRRLL